MKNSDVYSFYPTCSLVSHAVFRFRTLWAYGFDSASQGSFGLKNINGQDFSMNFQHILDFKVRKKFILQDWKDRSGKLICQTCPVLSHALAKLKGNPTECVED